MHQSIAHGWKPVDSFQLPTWVIKKRGSQLEAAPPLNLEAANVFLEQEDTKIGNHYFSATMIVILGVNGWSIHYNQMVCWIPSMNSITPI